MKKPKITEKQITAAIRNMLKAFSIFHWKSWQGPMSQPRGVSDILGIFKGKMLAIEVKGPQGKVSADQSAFLNRVSHEGGIAFVAYSVDDVIERLGLRDRFLV